MSFAREIQDFFRYFFQLKEEQKTIVFYAESSSYLAYLEGALEELLRRGESVCYVTSDLNDPIFQRASEKLIPLYQQRLLPLFFVLCSSPVVALTLTDLNNFNLRRSANDVKYVYLFHSLVSTIMMYRGGSFDHYDCILCTSPNQIPEIRAREQEASLKAKDLVEGGYYRLERVYAAYRQLPKTRAEKTLVLIAPSWGEKNLLNSGGMDLVELLLSLDYSVIFRPHPELKRLEPEVLERMRDSFQANPNFKLELDVGGDESLLLADVLIVDWSGIAFEYALGTERPVLFLDLPRKVKNPEYQKYDLEPLEVQLRDKLGKVAASLEEVPRVLEELLDYREQFGDELRKLRSEHVFHFGDSSQIAAETILRYAHRPRK